VNILEEIKQGESKTIEFKEQMPSNNSIAKTAIAFSNTSGGRLIIGVRDDREIVGIKSDDIFDLQDKIVSLIFDSCYPNILPKIYTINAEGKLLLVVEVFRGNLLPYYFKNIGKTEGTYVRVSSSNRQTDKAMLEELERQRVHRGFDEEENFEFSLDSLNLDIIYSEFAKIGKTCDIEKLKNLKLVNTSNDEFLPTNALAITLGKLANVSIKCARFKGSTMESFIDKKEFSGDLFTSIERSMEFLQNHLNLNAHIVGLQRVENYEIPLLALREILLNAVIHRDYTRNSDIKIAIYDDLLEIVSVGGLVNGLTIEDMHSGRSELRNRVLANLFQELGFIESWGSGIQKVENLCAEHHIRFEINEKGTFVEALFYRPESKKSASKDRKEMPNTTDSDRIRPIANKILPNTAEYDTILPNTAEYNLDTQKVIDFIHSNNKITSIDIEQIFKVKQRRARDILTSLVSQSILQKVGKTRGSYYVLQSPKKKES